MGIPKAQRFNSARLQILFPLPIMPPLIGTTMLTAVQLNIKFRPLAKEIQIASAGRMLSAKFVAGETPVAQPAPDKFFPPTFFCEAGGRVRCRP